MHHHREVRRLLLRDHAKLAHLERKTRQRALHAVLHLRFREIRIGADLEGHRQVQHPIRGRHRRHIEHVFDAVDLFFERGRDGLGDDLWISARVGCGDHD